MGCQIVGIWKGNELYQGTYSADAAYGVNEKRIKVELDSLSMNVDRGIHMYRVKKRPLSFIFLFMWLG